MTFEGLKRLINKVCEDCDKEFETIYQRQKRCDGCKASHVYRCQKGKPQKKKVLMK